MTSQAIFFARSTSLVLDKRQPGLAIFSGGGGRGGSLPPTPLPEKVGRLAHFVLFIWSIRLTERPNIFDHPNLNLAKWFVVHFDVDVIPSSFYKRSEIRLACSTHIEDIINLAVFRHVLPRLRNNHVFVLHCGYSLQQDRFGVNNFCADFLGNKFQDRKSTRLNSSHVSESRMPSSA